jgi:hypothetical protein
MTATAPAPATIKEAELLELSEKREEYRELQKQLKTAESSCKALENDLINRLQAGAKVQGKLTAVIEEKAGASRPPWKTEYLDHMEHEHDVNRVAEEQRVQLKYPPDPTERLVIGNAPLRVRGSSAAAAR